VHGLVEVEEGGGLKGRKTLLFSSNAQPAGIKGVHLAGEEVGA